MFKVPDWEESVPKNNVSFTNKPSAQKQTKPKRQIELKPKKETKKPFQQKPKKGNKKPFAPKLKPERVEKHNSAPNGQQNSKSRKRKLETHAKQKKNKQFETKTAKPIQDTDNNLETQNFDEILLSAKRKKFNEKIENEDKEDILLTEKKKKKQNGLKDLAPKTMKDRLKSVLESKSNRTHIDVMKTGNKLRERMLERLKAAQFRYLNEKLYTSSGSDAQQLFQSDPAAFQTYHEGYQLQVKKWPVKPLDVIVKKIKKMPKSHLIADMGCGEAALSKRVPHKVRSFDLVATAPEVEACDMARTPLLTASMNVVVYCLALMGTDLTQYLVEANRVLKMGGHLLIAEVESRFEKLENFTKEVERLGFNLKELDKSNQVFYFMEFTKVRDPPVKKAKLPVLTLKPCLYKKR